MFTRWQKFVSVAALAVLALFVVGQASTVLFTEDFEDGVWNGNGATNLTITGNGTGWPQKCAPDAPQGVKKGILGLYALGNPTCKTIVSGTAIMWNNVTAPVGTTQFKVDFYHFSNIASTVAVFKLKEFWHYTGTDGKDHSVTVTVFSCTGTGCNTGGVWVSRSFTTDKPFTFAVTTITAQWDISGSSGTVTGTMGAIDNIVETALP